MGTDVPAVKMTATVRRVLAALADRPGQKLGVRDLARITGRSPSAVRSALAQLGKGHLVRHLLQSQDADRPPYLVFWVTTAGREVAAATEPAPADRG